MTTEYDNIAESLAALLPKSEILLQARCTSTGAEATPDVFHVAVPKSHTMVEIDTEALRDNPRRAKGLASMADADTFVTYVNEFKRAGTAVWCDFDPMTAKLGFTAVIDENAPTLAGWRGHQAVYVPRMSIEWGNWKGKNGAQNAMGQVEFAEFLEKVNDDIANVEGLPTSLQLMTMATEFVARQDMVLRSSARLSDGGVNLTYVSDSDAGTLETMKLFKGFAIGIPVFWTTPKVDANGSPLPLEAFRIDARLKYRVKEGKVSFWYELIRPDRTHQLAAVELIESIKTGIGNVPLRLGAFA